MKLEIYKRLEKITKITFNICLEIAKAFLNEYKRKNIDIKTNISAMLLGMRA
jgi:hypothetical protein